MKRVFAMLAAIGVAELPATAAENGRNETASDPARIEFVGNARFSRNALLVALRRYHIALNGDFTRTEADDAAFFLREFYFVEGYADASVNYTFQTPPSFVRFDINEGRSFLIGQVKFVGNEAKSAERLRDIFDAAVRQHTLNPFLQLRYVAGAVEFATNEIQRSYHQEGYLMASCNVESISFTDRRADIRIEVIEGLRYRIDQISVVDHGVSETGLEDELHGYLGMPYQGAVLATLRTRVQDWHRRQGYLNSVVRVEAEENSDTGAVVITVAADPGVRYRLGDVRIEGLTATQDKAVRRRISLKPGEWYNVAEVDESVRRLWFTGAFDEATATHEIAEGDLADLVITMEEARAKQVRFKLGYSQWDRAFGEVHYVDRNFIGSLNRFSADVFASEKGYGASTALADPWFFNTEATGSVALFFSRRELPAYRTTEYGGSLAIERRYNMPNETGYRIAYGWKRAADSQIFGDDIDTGQVNYTLGGVAFSQTWDTRNDVLAPMKGLFARHEVEAISPVLLGDLSFFRLAAHVTYYHPLREITPERPFVPFVALNHAAGLLFPYGDTEFVPVQERFFLGGPNTIRSYQLYGFGPKDSDGDPTGGLASWLWNFEVQWPVWNNIYAVGFSDIANLAPSVSEVMLDDTQVAVGAGMRLYTPIGAVRVDYGYNVNPRPGDPVGNWQVGFGFTF